MGKKIFFTLSLTVIMVSSVIAANYSVRAYKAIGAIKGARVETMTRGESLQTTPAAASPQWTLSEYRKLHNSAAALLKMGQNEEAIKAYKKILEINPYDAETYKMLAYISAGNATETQNNELLAAALDYMEKAFEVAPTAMAEKDTIFMESLQKHFGRATNSNDAVKEMLRSRMR